MGMLFAWFLLTLLTDFCSYKSRRILLNDESTLYCKTQVYQLLLLLLQHSIMLRLFFIVERGMIGIVHFLYIMRSGIILIP